MKAAFFRKTGGPDVIEWGELPMPTYNENQVLVKVSAVAANPVDTYVRSGKYQLPASLPYILGSDLVGVVEKTGSKVTQFKAGDRVWSNSLGFNGRQGCFAEHVVVDQDLLYPAPSNVDDINVVAALQAGTTASLGLVREAMLKASDIIFVNGGSGNVGSAVIQMAVARGAKVIASTSSPEKAAWCKSLGAELVLDYRKDNFQQGISKVAPQGVNVFWDTSRNPNFEVSVGLLAPKGKIVLMAGAEAHPSFPVGPFYHKECSMHGFMLFRANSREMRQCAEMVNLCLENKQLKSKIAKVMPLASASKAHALMDAEPDMWGRIVLTV